MPKTTFLDFEEDLRKIQSDIDKLTTEDQTEGAANEIAQLEKRYAKRMAEIYSELTDWQIVQVARHPARPYTLDYIEAIFDDFVELHGDREAADDASIVAGLAHLGTHSVMVIGHQKGRDVRERTHRNFGMTRPEGYRKAIRLMKLAEKYALPVITFVDTPGAFPGIDAEEHNQSEAIGRAILELTRLRVPVISTVIGEGGSGGALALAVADTVMVLQYAIYSVISPEGCASILWKDAAKASQAADALSLTAPKLLKLGLVDKIVSEPLGGAHRDPKLMMLTLKKTLIDQLRSLLALSTEDLLARRERRLMHYGKFKKTPEENPPEVKPSLMEAPPAAAESVTQTTPDIPEVHEKDASTVNAPKKKAPEVKEKRVVRKKPTQARARKGKDVK